MTKVGLLVLVLAGSFLAGCTGPPAAEGPSAAAPEPTEAAATAAPLNASLSEPFLVLSDPAGDATEHNTGQTNPAFNEGCKLVPASQRSACRDAAPDERLGGTPAPEALDVVGLSVQESATWLVVRVQLVSLAEGVEQFVAKEGREGTVITVVMAAGTSCTNSYSFVVSTVRDAVFASAQHARNNDACEPQLGDPLQGRCATVNACYTRNPWHIEPGSPGTLVLSVPRAQTALMDEGLEVSSRVIVRRVTGGLPGGFVQPGRDIGTGQMNFDSRATQYVVDSTDVGKFTLQQVGDPESWGESVTGLEIKPATGTVVAGDTDIQRIDLHDDPQNFSFTTTVRELSSSPADLTFGWQFTTPAKHHYVVTAVFENGTWSSNANRWLQDRQIPIDSTITATPGTPGNVTVTIPRSSLPGVNASGLTRAFWGNAYHATRLEGADGPAGFYYVTASAEFGTSLVLPPYRFATDAAQASESPALELTDAIGDVKMPPDATADPSFRAGRFDISYAAVRAAPGGRVRLDIGITALDAITVPRLYDAILYGAGIQTPRGGWMVALLQDKTAPPSAVCGADVAFLTPDPKPPALSAGVPVSWTLAPASGDAAALLSFDVPESCFGLEGRGEDLVVTRLTLRTAVIGNQIGAGEASTTLVLDESNDPEGGRLVFPNAVAPLAWYVQPFGINEFWNILGVVSAVVLSLISAGVVIAKRLRMKRYLIELEDLADEYHDAPRAYAEALVALRQRLFADLLSNRLTEGHFVMVEERLRGSLSSTRINAFGRAFYHLPPALMIRLQSLLADGRFSVQDHRVLTEMLHELDIPSDSRRDVVAQIDLWSQQDQAVTKVTRLARAKRGWRRFLPSLRAT